MTPPILPRSFFESKHPTGVESSLGVRVLHLVAFHLLPSRGRSYMRRHVCAYARARVCVRVYVYFRVYGRAYAGTSVDYIGTCAPRDCRVGGKADIAGGVSKPFRRPCREFSTAWFSVAVGRSVHQSPRVRLIVARARRIARACVLRSRRGNQPSGRQVFLFFFFLVEIRPLAISSFRRAVRQRSLECKERSQRPNVRSLFRNL